MKLIGKVFAFFLRAAAFCLRNLWIPLSLLLTAQAGLLYVAVSEVRIPDRAVDELLMRLEKEGFSGKIGGLYLRNLTVVTAEDVRVDMLRGGDPLLKVRRLAVKLAPSALISGNWIPLFVYADGAELFCPAANSATGRSERLISSGSLISRRRSGEIELGGAEFELAGAKFAVFGKFPGTRRFFFGENGTGMPDFGGFSDIPVADGAKPLSARVGALAGTLSSALSRPELRQVLGAASITAQISPDGNEAMAVDVSALVRSIDFFEKARAEKISAEQRFSVRPSTAEVFPRGPLRAEAKALSFNAGDEFSEKIFGRAERLCAAAQIPEAAFSADAELSARLPKKVAARVGRLRAVSLTHGEAELRSVLFSVAPQKSWVIPDSFDLRLNAVAGTTALSCAGTLSAQAGRPLLNLVYDAVLDKDELLAFPQLNFVANQEDMRVLRFAEPPRVRGRVVFGPDGNFGHATFEFSSGHVSCGDLFFRSLNAAGTVSAKEIRVPEIRALGPDFSANADVFTEFSPTGAFRIRTWGSVDPAYIDGRLGWFWERIWRDLRPAPSERRPRADIDVHGNWGDRWECVFGAIAGENCFANGVLVDKVRLRVYEDPQLIAAFDMGFERGKDLVTGTLQWHYAMEPTYHFRDFRFLFEGSIPPKDVLRIVGEGLPEALSELETAGAGTAVVSGLFSGDDSLMRVNVSGSVPGEFSIFGIRGEDFSGDIIYDNGVVLVGNPFSARSDSGTISGKILVRLPEDGAGAAGSVVDLDLELKNVRRSRLTDAFSALAAHVGAPAISSTPEKGAAETPPADEREESPEEGEDAEWSRVDAVFAGTMTVPDMHTLDAAGKFSLHEKDLFELQVFGGFSRLLASMNIDLTTFMLNRAEGTFTVRDGVAFFPDLRVYGRNGEVDVRADVAFPELKIRGEAVFRNLRGTRIPLLGRLVKWGSSSTEMLPVEISGTLNDIKWSVSPTLSRMWSDPDDDYGIVPERVPAEAPEEP